MNRTGNHLVIEPVAPDGYGILLKFTQSWEIQAKKKENGCQKGSKKIQIFKASQSINQGLTAYFQGERRYADAEMEVYLCKNREGIPQGIMTILLADEHFYVDSLVVDPEKIKSGVGRFLLGYAERRAVVLNKKRIELFAFPSSEGFYERNGYGVRIINMVKTTRKVKREIKKMLKNSFIL